jgi:hypothetical protein
MAGQPPVFDCATVIASEDAVPLNPPYSILESGENLRLRSYFHCSSPDGVVRKTIKDILTLGTVTVQYFFQDLQALAIMAPVPPEAGGPWAPMTPTEIEEAFRPGGDLARSGLDPTDDYYVSKDTGLITTGPGMTLNIPSVAVNGTWRVLTVLHADNAGDKVSAFDDSLVIHVQG